MKTTRKAIVYTVNSDLNDGTLYAEFETKDAAIEYAKRNLDKLPFVDELRVSLDADGEIDEVFKCKNIWDHTMADGVKEELDDDYWDTLAAMYDDSEKHAIGDTTWFEEGWLDKNGVWVDADEAALAAYEKAMAAKKAKKGKREDYDTNGLVETLEENEDTVECKECFDLFPKADCIKVAFGYICPTCAEGGTVSEEDLFKLDFPEYEKMSVGNDMIPEDPMLENELDPISTPEEAVPFLVKDEEEAIAGYEKAAEVVADSDLENKEEILDTIEHIKEEEEEHIEELTNLTDPATEAPEALTEDYEDYEGYEDYEDYEGYEDYAGYEDLDAEDSEVLGTEDILGASADVSTDVSPDEMKQRLKIAKLANKLQKANLKTAKTSTKVHNELAKHASDVDKAQQALATNKVNYKNQKAITKTQKEIAKQNTAADDARKELATAKVNLRTQGVNRKIDPEAQELEKQLDRVKLATKIAKRHAKLNDIKTDANLDFDDTDEIIDTDEITDVVEESIGNNSMTEKVDPIRGLRKITKEDLYDCLVNKGESVDIEVGDQGYGPEDTGSFSDGGYYGGSVVYVEFYDGKFGATEFFRSESGAEKEGYWDFETSSFDKLWDVLISTFEPEDCVDCDNKKKDPLNEDLVLIGTLASALALSMANMANAAVGGFFWDSLKKFATSIFKRKPKSKWFAYKNHIIEQTEEGQINIWNLNGEQVGTDLKTIKLAKQLVKNLSKTEDQEIPVEDSSEVAAVAEKISDPIVEIDPDSLEAIEEVPVDEISIAPEEDDLELTDIR